MGLGFTGLLGNAQMWQPAQGGTRVDYYLHRVKENPDCLVRNKNHKTAAVSDDYRSYLSITF